MSATTPREWIGREERSVDVVSASVIRRRAALLDHDRPTWPTETLPPLGHWLHFASDARQCELGEDGHPRRGTFLPPVALPRRMWAGSTVEFLAPIRVGETMHRRSTIVDVRETVGKTGPLVFVTICHEITTSSAVAIRETQELVYRHATRESPPDPEAAAGSDEGVPAAFTRLVHIDAVMLFRYSALTYNSHRIHYDRRYATDMEGYPGLIVHGPLLATLLLDLYWREHSDHVVSRFRFQARRPLIEGDAATLSGSLTATGAALQVSGSDGRIRMTASVTAARSGST